MRKPIFFWFWFWALLVSIYAPAAHADGIESRPLEEFSFFQWGALHGLNTQTLGWDVHLGGQLGLDALYYDSDNVKDNGLRWQTVNLLVLGNFKDQGQFHL